MPFPSGILLVYFHSILLKDGTLRAKCWRENLKTYKRDTKICKLFPTNVLIYDLERLPR